MEQQQIKQEVKKKYGALAATETAGCGDPCCADTNLPLMADRYDELDGYVPEADLALGCGIPTQVAQISIGDTVVDLGSGAGNDAFVARRLVGETGRVIGLDMTPEMIQRAEKNTAKLGFQNVEFVLGDIERMDAIPTDTADVVISNCVMNLVPDKVRAFAEVHRILKPRGHFSISDIVYRGELPSEFLEVADLYAGCVAGSSEQDRYLGIIKTAGFKNIRLAREKRIDLPDEFLLRYLPSERLAELKQSDIGLYSVTVYAEKS